MADGAGRHAVYMSDELWKAVGKAKFLLINRKGKEVAKNELVRDGIRLVLEHHDLEHLIPEGDEDLEV